MTVVFELRRMTEAKKNWVAVCFFFFVSHWGRAICIKHVINELRCHPFVPEATKKINTTTTMQRVQKRKIVKSQILSQHIFFHFVFNFKLTSDSSNGTEKKNIKPIDACLFYSIYVCRCVLLFSFSSSADVPFIAFCSFSFRLIDGLLDDKCFGCHWSEKMATKAQPKSGENQQTSWGG